MNHNLGGKLIKRLSLSNEELATFEEEPSPVLPPADIVSYNELRSCADLFRMQREGDLEIQPTFQRSVVWPDASRTRFIDSLIKSLPIPSMCFSVDYGTQKWQVIDGLQRMSSIISFLDPASKWVLSNLSDVDQDIRGKAVSDFHKPDSSVYKYFRIVSNLTIPVTVLRCDYSKPEHMEYLFVIFNRLNSGGYRLTNQEIRNCIYSGGFNFLLHDLTKQKNWAHLCNLARVKDERFRRQELVLRFFAFYESFEEYGENLATFLNTYMNIRRNASESQRHQLSDMFKRTVNLLSTTIFSTETTERSSIMQLEAAMVGVARNYDALSMLPKSEVLSRFNLMLSNDEFGDEKLSAGLLKPQRVLGRLNEAVRVFGGK